MASIARAAALAALVVLGGAATRASADDRADAGPWVGATTAEDVRVRAGPSQNFRVLERLPKGTWVVVTSVEGEFARVRVPGGVPVYVHADLVDMGTGGKSATVTRGDVLLRATPGQEYFPLEGQKLQKGDAVVVLGRESGERGEWVKILPPDRIECFAAVKLLERRGGEAERAEDLARLAGERRDAYTGGRSAEAFRATQKTLEAEFQQSVDGAAKALAAAPRHALPSDAGKIREGLTQVMTESDDASLRARAAAVSRDYAGREKNDRMSRARAEKAQVAADLEKRLVEIEAAYRKQIDGIGKAAPGAKAAKFEAIGTVRRNFDGSFELVKGEVVLHRIDSLRYDLDELTDLRVGIKGKDIKVDEERGIHLYRVDALEILE
jgi:hypothetical protein